MASKIQVNKFKKDIKIQKSNSGFLVNGGTWRQGDRVHARSTNHQTCPCCGTETEVYIHSFHGGGKICPGCGVLMCPGAAFIDLNRMTKQDLIDWIHLDLKISK